MQRIAEMDPSDTPVAISRRKSSTDAGPHQTMADHVAGVLGEMENLGIVTQLAGKIVGGVAVTQSYYQHVMLTEGSAKEVPACQLLIAKMTEGEVAMVPAQQSQLEAGHPKLPREAPVLSKIMSPAALTELHWNRVPAVVIFGCFVADEDELQEAAAAGIPISPSMSGPHPEELRTQMEVFFKQYKYPDNSCFIMRDWGFLIFGADLGDAIASFNAQLKETLVITSEAGNQLPGTEDVVEAAQGTKTIHGLLSNAFKRLQAKVGVLRSQSLPTDAAVPEATAAMKGPLDKIAAQCTSEPSSPMIGTDLPDSIRNISVTAHRTSSEAYRVPSFQTGFKPW